MSNREIHNITSSYGKFVINLYILNSSFSKSVALHSLHWTLSHVKNPQWTINHLTCPTAKTMIFPSVSTKIVLGKSFTSETIPTECVGSKFSKVFTLSFKCILLEGEMSFKRCNVIIELHHEDKCCVTIPALIPWMRLRYHWNHLMNIPSRA